MKQILFLLGVLMCIAVYANEINYQGCSSLQEVIEKESKELDATLPNDHEQLAQLYVSRGESYLLNAEYNKAIGDFKNANAHIEHCQDLRTVLVIAFRTAFGMVVGYDNLGIKEQTQKALEQLKAITAHVGCEDCLEHTPCKGAVVPSTSRLHFRNLIMLSTNKTFFSQNASFCKHRKDVKDIEEERQAQKSQDNYEDILGPNQPPDPSWCEEIVTGVGRAMDAIACLAPNVAVRVALIGVIETLITRGVKCCQAGGFWKACVAPITRKWKEWKSNKERNIFPNAQSLPLFIN